jgi:hypothetical protein
MTGGAGTDDDDDDRSFKGGNQSINKGMSSLGSGLAEALMAKGGLAKGGGPVDAKKPSQKPVKAGNSYDNDKVPAMLSAGEIVIPRSVTMGKDPVRGAADFVSKVIAKRGRK